MQRGGRETVSASTRDSQVARARDADSSVSVQRVRCRFPFVRRAIVFDKFRLWRVFYFLFTPRTITTRYYFTTAPTDEYCRTDYCIRGVKNVIPIREKRERYLHYLWFFNFVIIYLFFFRNLQYRELIEIR